MMHRNLKEQEVTMLYMGITKKTKTFFDKQIAVIKTAVCNENGEFYVDKVIEIIIAVVVGGLLLTSVYAIFQNTVLPGLAAKIQAIFS